ncbi:MAG: winged helix-turn-helix domain-containing protein [Dehalococcoidia bacterium]|nr:MAG: hypothetical protein CBD90_02515 [Chloroflexi bacterium TMED230]RZP14194.1 MAG: winged helix family transcriptional regulator [Chloroflexota bacterium]|tara:strand:+ start:3632 stop:3904 length:273 start_codon:yes stop_codon:yes gene_type:complete
MLEINENYYQIICKDKILELTPKEYDVLKLLIDNSYKVTSKSEIISELWPKVELNSRVVDTYVSRIRKKLINLGHPGIRVQNKRGYILIS